MVAIQRLGDHVRADLARRAVDENIEPGIPIIGADGGQAEQQDQ